MLPMSRNENCAPETPVRSALLNDIQDCIVVGAHGLKTMWYPPFSRVANDSGTITFTNGFVFAGANTSAMNYIAAPIDQGKTIAGLRARVKGTGAAGNVVVSLIRWRDQGPETTEATLTIVSPPNSWATYAVVMPTPLIVAAGDAFWLRCAFALTNQAVVGIGVDYDGRF